MNQKMFLRQKRASRFSDGFTLIELLVVISIIALLMSIMMPALRKVRFAGQKITCSAHQRSVLSSMLMYVNDYQAFYPAYNGNRWLDLGEGSGKTGDPLEPTSTLAYWGVGYKSYGLEKELFKCPSKKTYDGHWKATEPGDEEAFIYSDFGLNGYICWEEPYDEYGIIYSPGEGRRKYEKFKRPSETIAFHDHFESMMDDNGDMFYINPDRNQSENLEQWKSLEKSQPGKYGGAVKECWRHDESSNILWLDGHASNMKKTNGEVVKYSWYTGGIGGLK